MYISLFLGVPMGVPIYNLWGARGVCSPQTTWSSSCSQNIWGVALWTWFLASYRLLCRQKMTWFWHCHKHILVITQFDNHRHSYVIVYRDIMYNIYKSGIRTNDHPAAGAVQDFEDEKYFYLVMDCTFLWRMLVLNNQEDQSLLHVATAKRQEQCRGGDLAEYVWRAQPCEGETSSEQSEWTRNDLMKPSCSGFLLYAEFIYFWSLVMFEQLEIHSYRISNHFWVTSGEVKCLEPMDAQSYEFWVAKAGNKNPTIPTLPKVWNGFFEAYFFFSKKRTAGLREKNLPFTSINSWTPGKKLRKLWTSQVMQHTLSAIAYCHSKAVIHKATQLQTMLTKCEQYVLCHHLQNPMLSELDQIT